MGPWESIRPVLTAAVQALEKDHRRAAETIDAAGMDLFGQSAPVFGALIAVLTHDAQLLGLDPADHGRQVLAFYFPD